MDEAEVLEAWVSSLRPPVTDRLQAQDGLVPALEALLRKGRAAWPKLRLPPQAVLQHLERVALAAPQPLTLLGLHGEDLFLVVACLDQQPEALRAFEERLATAAARVASRRGAPAHLAEEARQRVLHQVVLPREDGRRALELYRAQGPLEAWLSVALTRELLALTREQAGLPTGDQGPLPEYLVEKDPELAYLQRLYQRSFKGAFEEALKTLPDRDLHTLKDQLVERLSLEEMAQLYQLHPVSVARRITAARERCVAAVRGILARELGVDRWELDSIMGLVRSGLELSLERVLGPPEKKKR